VDRPGKVRQQLRRTIAEALRRLLAKESVDEETKDLAALIVFSLRGISRTVDEAATAWEKRNYFVKADRFRREWAWAGRAADEMESLIRSNRWKRLPAVLAAIMPYFSDVTVKKMVRRPSLWAGCYRRLVESPSTDRRSSAITQAGAAPD
jgi:hypothetical protein